MICQLIDLYLQAGVFSLDIVYKTPKNELKSIRNLYSKKKKISSWKLLLLNLESDIQKQLHYKVPIILYYYFITKYF